MSEIPTYCGYETDHPDHGPGECIHPHPCPHHGNWEQEIEEEREGQLVRALSLVSGHPGFAVADLSKGERVVSAEDKELIRAEVTAKIMEQYPAMQHGVAKVATTAIDLFWSRLTEGRE